MPVDVEKLSQSSVGVQAIRKALKDADDSNRPEPTEAELKKIADLADAHNVYGFDAKQDRNGNWIEQGVGAWPHNVSSNHLASVKRYEGIASWEKQVRQLWKDAPERARKLGLPELPKA